MQMHAYRTVEGEQLNKEKVEKLMMLRIAQKSLNKQILYVSKFVISLYTHAGFPQHVLPKNVQTYSSCVQPGSSNVMAPPRECRARKS